MVFSDYNRQTFILVLVFFTLYLAYDIGSFSLNKHGGLGAKLQLFYIFARVIAMLFFAMRLSGCNEYAG